MSTEDHTPLPAGETPLVAFMHSHPTHTGKPESSFYWFKVKGKDCIAKELNIELGAHLIDFVSNEKQVLRLLGEKKAPVCKLVEYPNQPEWLVTEFGGLSLDLLGGKNNAGWPPLPIQEYVSVWVYFMDRAEHLDRLNAVPMDLAGRNLVVPLGSNGQLKLNDAVSIDHAHTVVPGSELPGGSLKRPMWIGADENPNLAPELRDALNRDQQKLRAYLRNCDASSHNTMEGKAHGSDDFAARNWLAYDKPQEIQALVDRGAVNADKVIQFSVGHDIHRRLRKDHPLTPGLALVVQRMRSTDPAERYDKMELAAAALKAVLGGQLSRASVHVYKPNLPQDLIPRPHAGNPDFDGLSDGDGDGTIVTGPGRTKNLKPNKPKTEKKPRETLPNWIWPLLAAALAIALGVPLGTWLAAP